MTQPSSQSPLPKKNGAKRPQWWAFAQDCIARLRATETDIVDLERRATDGDAAAVDTLMEYEGGDSPKGTYILAKNRTQHVGKRQVQKKVEDVRKSIGVMSGKDRLVPHGWRYTAATQLADAGVDMRDIQSVTGHKTLSMVQKYTAQANQKAASRRAQTAREQNKNETGKC